jgi:hypothetical protein
MNLNRRSAAQRKISAHAAHFRGTESFIIVRGRGLWPAKSYRRAPRQTGHLCDCSTPIPAASPTRATRPLLPFDCLHVAGSNASLNRHSIVVPHQEFEFPIPNGRGGMYSPSATKCSVIARDIYWWVTPTLQYIRYHSSKILCFIRDARRRGTCRQKSAWVTIPQSSLGDARYPEISTRGLLFKQTHSEAINYHG